jgi:primosomal protein N' (replication factor Y)
MILRIALPTPLHRLFDYLPPVNQSSATWPTGVRVRVPFGKREMIGILMSIESKSDIPIEKLRPALEILDETSIIDQINLKLCQWVADYYHEPLGEVLNFALPVALREGKALSKVEDVQQSSIPLQEPLSLNEQQTQVVEKVISNLDKFQSFLIDGVTGSGKTEVYLQILKKVLEQNKQALVLVPEISLTPQMIARFTQRFGEIAVVLHSGLTNKQRFEAWQKLRENQKSIAIGTRSAIFSAMPKLGLIIIDEEHDLSFKQQEGLRYSARDVAIMRARMENIPIVLGSATPSLESIYNCETNRFTKLQLTQRAGNISLPRLQVVDIRNEKLQGGLSRVLTEAMEHHLQQDKQVMLFLNRRGYAPILLCHACGWIATCPRCDRAYTWHAHIGRLRCHHCDGDKSQPNECKKCSGKSLQPVGHGTERIEQTLESMFPDYKIARLDRDNTRKKGSLETLLESIHNKESQILLGTQMLAKGHHFPDVSLVGILDVDGGLFSSDFRGAERMAQLITQVAGRAGREKYSGEVLIQTRHPQSALLEQLVHHNYASFAKIALEERRAAMLPPYSFLILLRAEATHPNKPMDFLEKCREYFLKCRLPGLHILGPAVAPMPRRAGKYRAQLILQAGNRKVLHQAMKTILADIESWPLTRQVRWSVDVDPQEMY